jgi:ATP phosphoribosyltransferase regulatory subunit
MAYYTGLVFEVRVQTLGPQSPVVTGGRYDALMRAAGAGVDVAAVGAAVHTERLLAAIRGAAP